MFVPRLTDRFWPRLCDNYFVDHRFRLIISVCQRHVLVIAVVAAIFSTRMSSRSDRGQDFLRPQFCGSFYDASALRRRSRNAGSPIAGNRAKYMYPAAITQSSGNVSASRIDNNPKLAAIAHTCISILVFRRSMELSPSEVKLRIARRFNWLTSRDIARNPPE